MDTNIPTPPEIPKVDDTIANTTQVTGQIVTTSNNAESSIGSVSIRGLIALILILAVSLYPAFHIVVPESLVNLSIGVSAYYFGKSQGK